MDNTPSGANVFELSAVDIDEGSNSVVFFNLQPSNSFLTLNASTGIILTAGGLTPGMYNFTAIATDSGEPSLSSTALVSITVISFDSTLPQFNVSLYEGEVVENSLEGVSILTLFAEDPLNEGGLTYSLPTTPATPPFSVNPVTGQLTTSGNPILDRESQMSTSFKSQLLQLMVYEWELP